MDDGRCAQRELTYVQGGETPVFELAQEVSWANALRQVKFPLPALSKRINGLIGVLGK